MNTHNICFHGEIRNIYFHFCGVISPAYLDLGSHIAAHNTSFSSKEEFLGHHSRGSGWGLLTAAGFKFNFFDSLLKLASGIIFYLLNLSANLLFHTYKHC